MSNKSLHPSEVCDEVSSCMVHYFMERAQIQFDEKMEYKKAYHMANERATNLYERATVAEDILRHTGRELGRQQAINDRLRLLCIRMLAVVPHENFEEFDSLYMETTNIPVNQILLHDVDQNQIIDLTTDEELIEE